ncbi:carbohydrate ABC transporter permease [Caldimonas brevitalea]|uniref:Cytochrome C biogenesis protein n=1 Tax=Caldimonas brevitalea TaxID=413882 RepID=A0A0G3BGN0_9BURK|nr:sugar ABC transporter permease [Caldimonas brevitalea]AKJ28482.1 cytochrome C biogenesis protein [Caldimonas brevitalea]
MNPKTSASPLLALDAVVAPAPSAGRPARRRRRLKPWDWAPYLFISPFFVLFAIFGLFPLLFSAYVSFFRWEATAGLEAMVFEGWGNYTYLLQLDGIEWSQAFTSAFWADLYDRDFWRALYNTLWIGVLSGIPQHLVAIPLAFFIHTQFKRFRNPVIGMYFLPFITNTVAVAMVFTALFSRDFGVVNLTLTGLGNWDLGGLKPLAWLLPTEPIDWGSSEYQRWTVAVVVWWRYVGWNTVLYLAALQTIPKDLYEAATMDGANKWQQLWYITVPMLRPMMFFAVTLTLIGSLQLFEEPYILTGGTGGSGKAAQTSSMLITNYALNDGDFGTASALAWLLFVFIGILTYVNNKIFGRKND